MPFIFWKTACFHRITKKELFEKWSEKEEWKSF